MGIELVKLLAARHAARLSQRALVVMLYMALHALDEPNAKGQPARLYFAGWVPLARALGYETDDDKLTRPAEEKVRRAIKELRGAGLVEPIAGHAQTGTRQCYRLHLDLFSAAESPTDSEGHSPSVSEGQEPLRFGVESPSDSEGPRTKKDQGQDSSQDVPLISATQVQTAREKSHNGWTSQHEFNDDGSGASCSDCGLMPNHSRHQTWRSA